MDRLLCGNLHHAAEGFIAGHEHGIRHIPIFWDCTVQPKRDT